MKGHAVLTIDELHLIQAIIGKGPALHGLEEFAMSEERRPSIKERQSLINKEILIKDKDRYVIDPTMGYLFSTLADNKAYVHGQVMWNDGMTARLNIYIFETEFMVVYAGGYGHIEFMWLPSIPMLIGCLCSFIHEHKTYNDKASASPKQFSANSITAITEAVNKAKDQGIDAECCISFETVGAGNNWAGARYVIAIDKGDNIFYAEPDKEGMTYSSTSLKDALLPINRKILGEHIRAISISDTFDENEDTAMADGEGE